MIWLETSASRYCLLPLDLALFMGPSIVTKYFSHHNLLEASHSSSQIHNTAVDPNQFSPEKILISKMQHLNNQTLRNTQCLDSTKPTKRTSTAVQNLQAQYTAEEQLLRWLYLYLQHLANSVLQTHFVRLGNTRSR